MPQFWIEDFLPQIVWLATAFAVLYFLMARMALPRVAVILENRQYRIEGDLDLAAEHKRRAEAVMAEYEEALAEARAQAQAVIAEAQAAGAVEAERRGDELGDRLRRQANEAQARIEAAKTQAMDEVRTVAADLAQGAVERLIGVEVAKEAARSAVDAAMEEAR